MTKMIFYGLMIYFLYKVIFDVVVPVSNGVKTVKQNMEKMQREAARATSEQGPAGSASYAKEQANSSKKEIPKDAEYIDFEEVKR